MSRLSFQQIVLRAASTNFRQQKYNLYTLPNMNSLKKNKKSGLAHFPASANPFPITTFWLSCHSKISTVYLSCLISFHFLFHCHFLWWNGMYKYIKKKPSLLPLLILHPWPPESVMLLPSEACLSPGWHFADRPPPSGDDPSLRGRLLHVLFSAPGG